MKGEALHPPVEMGAQPRLTASNRVSRLTPRAAMVENPGFYSARRRPKESYDRCGLAARLIVQSSARFERKNAAHGCAASLRCENREELFWAVEGFEGEGGGHATGKIGQDVDA